MLFLFTYIGTGLHGAASHRIASVDNGGLHWAVCSEGGNVLHGG